MNNIGLGDINISGPSNIPVLQALSMNIDFKKALPIVALGVFIADVIMSIVTYGAGAVFNF